MSTIDEALEMLEGCGPEFGGGLANHGPMAAEALCVLGRDDAVVPWVEGYRARLLEHPRESDPLRADDWHEALGDGKRIGDWIAFFDRELAEAAWPDVLDRWVPRLAPGIIASATHGVIRTGHATRALGQGESPARVHELAEGLGYWAARFERLPEGPSAVSGLRPSEAVSRIEWLPADQRQLAGAITPGLRALDGFAPFAGAIGLVDTSGDISETLSDLTETFARVYIANNGLLIHFIHAVTGPSSVRLLAPYVSEETAQLALRYAWQAAASLYAAFGTAAPLAAVEDASDNWDDIVDQAVAGGDEHAIKFAEACLREYQLNPSPAFLVAARDAAGRLGRRG